MTKGAIYEISKRYKTHSLPNVGDLVRVVNEKLQSYGLIGRVIDRTGNTCVVCFLDWHGEEDKVLSFNYYNLEKVEENTMVTNAVSGNYDIAWVRFNNGQPFEKVYAFALFDSTVEPGDYVLVDSNGEFKCAMVSSIIKRDEFHGDLPTKEVVCKVDLSEFEARKKIREQKQILRRKMDAILAKNQELILYKAIAKENPEMAAMLEEYTSLGDDV